MDRGSLLPRRLPPGFGVRPVNRDAEPFQRQVELIVRGVQVLDDALQERRTLDVVADGKQKPMRNVDENGYLVEFLGGYRRVQVHVPPQWSPATYLRPESVGSGVRQSRVTAR